MSVITTGRASAIAGAALLTGLALVGVSREAFSHEEQVTERAVVLAPRAEGRIGTQEFVITYMDRKLTLFLQRYVDGVPTTGAGVEVTADLIPGTLDEIAPGIYRGEDWTLSGGRNEIELAITMGDTTETATVPLVIQTTTQSSGQTAALTAVQARTIPTTMLAGAAIATYVVVSLLFWRRSRRTA
jgi:hypothetical protein